MTPLVLANLNLWVTPLWLIALGVTIAAAILVALYFVLLLVSREGARRAAITVQESVLMPISYVVMAFVAVCVLAIPTVEVQPILDSLGRLPNVTQGVDQTVETTVPAREEDFELSVSFRASEMTRYTVESDQDIRVAGSAGAAYSEPVALVEGDDAYVWTKGGKRNRGFTDDVTTVYLTNEGDAPAAVRFSYATDVPIPAVHDLPVVVVSVVAVYLLYLGIQWLLPGVGNIATATAKDAMGQPLFLLILLLGGVAIFSFLYIPYNTFGEDVKFVLQTGLEVIMVSSILFAIWTASTSIADEIEGKTALTLLSKPISRRQFILGKFAGICWTVLVIFVVLGSVLMATISYKVVYDSRETANPTPKWEECYDTMIQATPGLTLSLLESIVLISISVALSTRLPMLPNLIICGVIYVLGHLGALIVQSSVGANEYVSFFGKLIAVVVPVLDHFNIQGGIAGGVAVPAEYLLWAAAYCVLYSSAAMLLALILFEDRDLA